MEQGVIVILEIVKGGGESISGTLFPIILSHQLASHCSVKESKSSLETAENNLSAVRFTPYMVFKVLSNSEGAKNSSQIARHQSHKAPARPFNGCAF